MKNESTLAQLSEHPIQNGLIIAAITIAARHIGLENVHHSLILDDGIGSFAGYSSYLGLSLARDYVFHKMPRSESLESRILNFVYQNPKLLALFGSATGAGLYPLLAPEYHSRELITGGIVAGGLVGELTPLVISTIRNLRNSSRSQNFIARISDFMFENPYMPGLAITSEEFITRFDRYPRTLIGQSINAFSALLMGLLSTYGTALAGGVLHSNSLKTHMARLACIYYHRKGNLDKATENQIRLVDLSTSREGRVKELVRLGDLYFDAGKQDKAFSVYRLALRSCCQKGNGLNHVELISRTFNRRKRRTGNKPHDLVMGVLEGNRKTIYELSQGVETSGDRIGLYVCGKAYEILGETEKSSRLKLAALEMLLEDESLERFGGKTRNTISMFPNDLFFNTEVIVKLSQNRAKLEWEEDLTRRIRKALSSEDKYDAPLPVGILEKKGINYLFFEFEPGETIFSRMQRNPSVNDFEMAIDALSLIYFSLGLDLARDRERNPLSYLQQTLDSIEDRVKDAILGGLSILVDYTQSVPRVLYKDPQPKNLLITEHGNLVLLDHEPSRPTPITHEAADLLDYLPVLDGETRIKLANMMFSNYCKRTRQEYHTHQLTVAYLSSRVIRALERYPHLSREPELRPLLASQLEDAARTITEIEDHIKFSLGEITRLELFRSALIHQVRNLQV